MGLRHQSRRHQDRLKRNCFACSVRRPLSKTSLDTRAPVRRSRLALTPPVVGRISDQAARLGFAAGAFEESVEEGAAVVEEFFPVEEHAKNSAPSDLAGKLERKAAQLAKDPGG